MAGRARSAGRRRLPFVTLTLAVLGSLAFAWAIAVHGFQHPMSDEPLDDGPIVVLGGDPQRLDVALTLRAERDDPALVLFHDLADHWLEAGEDCDRDEIDGDGVDRDEVDRGEVLCAWPEPVSTYGEARLLGRLQRERDWGGVTVVTSGFHTTRTRSVFQRCVDGPIAVVASDGASGHRISVFRASHEAAATLVSVLIHRDC